LEGYTQVTSKIKDPMVGFIKNINVNEDFSLTKLRRILKQSWTSKHHIDLGVKLLTIGHDIRNVTLIEKVLKQFIAKWCR